MDVGGREETSYHREEGGGGTIWIGEGMAGEEIGR